MPQVEELQRISAALTPELIKQSLSEWFGEETDLVRFEYGEGTGKGDSYLSDMYRITFYGKTAKTGREVNVRIIFKGMPANRARRITFKSTRFFGNEIRFYQRVLPALLAFQAEKNVAAPFAECPRVFASVTNGVDDFLGIEDLSVDGFKAAVRQEACDLNHLRIILECFARFHALSFAFRDQRPEEFARLTKEVCECYYYPENFAWYKNWWRNISEVTIDAVEQEYPNSEYARKIREFAIDDAFFRCCDAAADGTNGVFGHGDSWLPNFLVDYEDGTVVPRRVRMIDFQLARCGSPILDTSFFIYSCSAPELRKEHYADLLKHYYAILSDRIRGLGSDPDKVYSWDAYMGEVKKYSFFGLTFSFESVPVSMLEPEEAFEMDAIEGDEPYDISDVLKLRLMKPGPKRARFAGNFAEAVDNGYV